MNLTKKIATALAIIGLIVGVSLSEAKAQGSQSTQSLGPGHNQWTPGGVDSKTGAYGTTGKEGVTGSGQFGGNANQSGSRMGGATGSNSQMGSQMDSQMGSQQEFSGKIQKKGKNYMLMTSDGQQYRLQGNTKQMAKLQGKQARVTGTPDPNNPDTLTIMSAVPEQKRSMGGTSGSTGSGKTRQ